MKMFGIECEYTSDLYDKYYYIHTGYIRPPYIEHTPGYAALKAARLLVLAEDARNKAKVNSYKGEQ